MAAEIARRAVGLLLIAGAAGFALSRAPDRPVETLIPRWALPPSDFVDVAGMAVHIRDEGPRGDPLPVVLVHGTGASLHTWEGWARGLRARHRVIRCDLPGFGLTGPLPDGSARVYGGDDDARFMLDLMDRLGVRRFVIGGNSLGGEVAWRTATLAPERVAGLVLVDAAGLPVAAQQMPPGFAMARVPVLNRIGEHLLPRSLIERSLASVYGDPTRITPELVDRYFELTLREGNRRALTERIARWQPGRDAARLAGIRQPTLILWGGQDRLIPPEAAAIFQQRIAGSRLQVFEALGHVPHEEDPAQTLKPVADFLASLKAQG